MNFAKTAKSLREETGLSQQKLADKLGISSSGIAHLELSESEPKSSTLIGIKSLKSAFFTAFCVKNVRFWMIFKGSTPVECTIRDRG